MAEEKPKRALNTPQSVRDSGEWMHDLDDESVLAEFQGAASALEEFELDGVPAEEPVGAAGTPAPVANVDDAFDLSFDTTADEPGLTSPVPTSPIPTSPLPAAVSPPPAAMGPMSPVPMTPTPAAVSGTKGVSRTTVLVAVIVAVLVAGGAVAATIVLTRPEPAPVADQGSQGSQFILVQGNVVREGEGVVADAGATETPTPEPIKATPVPAAQPDAAPQQPPADAAPAKARPRVRATGSDRTRLTRAFAKQRGRVARCFEQHALEVRGVPQIDIDFSINQDGSVRQVALNPAMVNGTPLGGCIRSVANRTRFGPQSQPLDFRIPIKARRVQ